MKQSAKVLSFPDQSGPARSKWFGVLFHLGVASMLTLDLPWGVPGLAATKGLEILFILALLYGLFIRKRIEKSRYWRDNKLLVAILLGIFLVAFYPLLLPILLLAGLYWLMIGRSGREAPFFLRFHMLTTLILDFFIIMAYGMLSALLGLLIEILRLADLSVFLEPLVALLSFFFTGVLWGAAIWLSVAMLMNRTPHIPVVTGNVRYWA